MPRYKFQWGNLLYPVVKSLTDDYELQGQEPQEALHSWYGARPTDDFVKDNWDVLRESWLSKDTDARKSVVRQLWELGVGEGQGYPTNRASELEYLRSCRNAGRLR